MCFLLVERASSELVSLETLQHHQEGMENLWLVLSPSMLMLMSTIIIMDTMKITMIML